MFGSWVLNEIWLIDLSSASVGMLMSSSKLFLFSNEAHLNSGVRPLLELYCDIATKHVAFFSMCAKFNSIRIYQFTFELLQKYWRIDEFGEKKALFDGFAYLYTSPSILGELLEC